MGTKLRYGFKAEAERHSQKYREELKIEPHGSLCPWRLATYLRIPVHPLSSLKEAIPEAVNQFTEKDQGAFSAVTMFLGEKKLIIHNDSHSLHRQSANISHELAHYILNHVSTQVFDKNMCRNVDKTQEEEANHLGPTLLVPKEAAIHILKTKMSVEEAATAYKVSEELIVMRLNLSGAKRIFSRSASKRKQ
jgi:Zn-dependent peptidase ImmA (M78 family)